MSIRRWRLGGAPDEGNEAVERVLAVALLGAEALGGDHDRAVARHLPAGEFRRPRNGHEPRCDAMLCGHGTRHYCVRASPRSPEYGFLALIMKSMCCVYIHLTTDAKKC